MQCQQRNNQLSHDHTRKIVYINICCVFLSVHVVSVCLSVFITFCVSLQYSLGCLDLECVRSDYCYRCFSLSVCHAPALGFGVQKQLNGLRSCFGWRLLGAQGTFCSRSHHVEGERKRIRCSFCQITLISCRPTGFDCAELKLIYISYRAVNDSSTLGNS